MDRVHTDHATMMPRDSKVYALPKNGASAEPTSEGDPFGSRLPEGNYQVILRACERGHSFGRRIDFALFKVSNGPFLGTPLLRFYNVPERRRLARSSALSQDFIALTGLRPPTRPFRPRDLLEGCEVLARVVTVTKGMNGPLPEAAQYSKIERLLARTAGMPPILCGREPRG